MVIFRMEELMSVTNTITYYNYHAHTFISTTRNVDFHDTQTRFLDKLPMGSKILDFGCGSGRDTKYFLSQGYEVDATDGSEEICRLASEYIGIQVKHMLFQELEEENIYDGIWACSSILHLTYEELKLVFLKMARELKEEGVVYTFFKYGAFEGERSGRYFTNMTEEKFTKFLGEKNDFHIEELWISADVRPNRGEEKWLNLILRKN